MIDEEHGSFDTAPESDGYYEETVVEYVDTRRTRTVLALLLVILILLLVGVGYFLVRSARPAGAPTADTLPAGITWVRSLYAWGPSPEQMLNTPTAVDIGPDGTIWTLASKRYIVGYSPSGQVRKVISPAVGQQPGQVTSLEGIAVGDDGAIYVTDFGNNAVDVFSPAGAFLRSWGVQLPQVVDVKGNTVAIAATNGIGLFDTQGVLVAKWGSRGSKQDQVDVPHGIVIGDDGNIYVADTQNRRVKAYDQGGRLLWTNADPSTVGKNLMSTEGTAPVINGVSQAMQLPCGLTQDGAGRLLMVDAFTFDVIVLDPAKKGLITARFGEQGVQDGQFTYPTGVAYDKDRDTVIVADTSNNRLQVIRIPGTGGSAVRRTLKSLTDTPIWLCAVPLMLLLVALMLGLRGRNREHTEAPTPTLTRTDPSNGVHA
ncbi:MAG: NHL repeat-containing protein [Actinomycetia bacterium]|nr:NHL repeat-containing protein [Actinomycetes bacterium]